MKANPDKCHLLVTTNALTSVNINDFQITNSIEEKLLGKTSIVNSLLKTISPAFVRRQVKNCMH